MMSTPQIRNIYTTSVTGQMCKYTTYDTSMEVKPLTSSSVIIVVPLSATCSLPKETNFTKPQELNKFCKT